MSTNATESRRARILVLGRPGSGKGTQCGRLAARLGVPHVSTGDLFRETVTRDTPLGRVVKEYMDAGELVPDDLVLDVVADRLGDDLPTAGFVLDGFPRTVAQAEQLEALLGADGLDLAIELVVDPDVARRRLLQRLVCGDCGRPNGPADDAAPAACGLCGGHLEGRDDDQASTITRRLALHDEQTALLADWLEGRGLLVTIDGRGTPQEVADAVDRACAPLLYSDAGA